MSEPNSSDPEFDRVVDEAARVWLEEQETAVNEHPETETLIAFQEQRLAATAMEPIHQHLLTCKSCREEIGALGRFDQETVDDDASDSSDHLAGWQDFANRRQSAMPGRGPARNRRTWAWPLALAASVLFLVVGLRDLVPRLLAPGADATLMVLDLVPDGASLLRAAKTEQEFEISGTVDTLVPLVNVGDQTPYDSYRLALYDEAGKLIAEKTHLVRDAKGRFSFSVWRRLTPAGRYRVVLTGIETGSETELAVYSFRLRDGT